MIIAYSEKTLWSNIDKQQLAIIDEANWMNHYIATAEIECVEDCVRNIEDSLKAIKENLELLKGEEM